jgi:hypothetical protein
MKHTDTETKNDSDSGTEISLPRPRTLHWVMLSLIVASPIMIFLVNPSVLESVTEQSISPLWLYLSPTFFLASFLLVVGFYIFSSRKEGFVVANGVVWFLGLLFLLQLIPPFLHSKKDTSPSSLLPTSEPFDSAANNKIRTLSLLASQPQYFTHPVYSRLIHDGLLDKDPRVQQAARIVIEENFGIKLKNGAVGISQALELFEVEKSWALYRQKGSP